MSFFIGCFELNDTNERALKTENFLLIKRIFILIS